MCIDGCMGGRLAGWLDGKEGGSVGDEWLEVDPKNTDLGETIGPS